MVHLKVIFRKNVCWFLSSGQDVPVDVWTDLIFVNLAWSKFRSACTKLVQHIEQIYYRRACKFFSFLLWKKPTHFPIRLRSFYPPTHENNPEFYVFIISCKFFFFVDVIRFFNIFAVFYTAIIQPLNRKRNKMFGIRNEANLFWWNNREPFVYFFHQFLNSSFVKNGVF